MKLLVVLALLPSAPARAEDGLPRAEVFARAAALTSLGQRMFADPALSASGRMSCASCHSPAAAFGPPNALAVQPGGRDLRAWGVRAVPGLTYMQTSPPFTRHFFESDDDGDESVDNGPTGGLTWDGRVDRGAAQARIPLLSPFEMANAGEAEVVGKARAAGYDVALQRIFHDSSLFADTGRAFGAIVQALATYEEDWKSFYPYSSKYDAYLRGRAVLRAQEARGLALFEDPAKGNCASCHTSRPTPSGVPPAFSDHGMIALGVPRNAAIPANRDPTYHDMGLCGPLRTDLRDQPAYCGLFRTPSLRNVATRKSFFHNGLVHELRQAVAFYVQRDSAPEKWYPRRPDGSIDKFNDLPKEFRQNINTGAPFGPRPALTDAEINDVVAFLGTLTDGYQPSPAKDNR